MEVEQIEIVKKWPKPKSVWDIQVFLDFTNFYWQFIQGFSRIAAPLTSMLKTAAPPERSTLEEVGDGEGGDDVDGVDGIEIAKKSGKSKGQKTSKSQKLFRSGKFKGEKLKKPPKSRNSPNFDTKDSGPNFLILEARSAFNHLRLTFTKASILWHFDPECHIRIKTNTLDYAIRGVLSQLTSGNSPDGVVTKANLGQWHPVAFFSRKIIPAETRYETHDGELLAIVEAFKTWRHYLEGCKHEVLVLTDHNNLRRFMDTKSLSSRQVRWAQELSRYHFRIDYRQGKANAAADALSRFPQRSQDEEEELQAENGQIFHCLQNLLTSVNLASFSAPLYLHQVLIYGTYILPRL